MKNIFVVLISLLIFSPIMATAAITPGQVPSASDLVVQGSPVTDVPGLVGVIASVVTWTYTIFFIIAVLFILLAAFSFLTARGDTEKIISAKNQILWASVAIAIALISFSVSVIIRNILTIPAV